MIGRGKGGKVEGKGLKKLVHMTLKEQNTIIQNKIAYNPLFCVVSTWIDLKQIRSTEINIIALNWV